MSQFASVPSRNVNVGCGLTNILVGMISEINYHILHEVDHISHLMAQSRAPFSTLIGLQGQAQMMKGTTDSHEAACNKEEVGGEDYPNKMV